MDKRFKRIPPPKKGDEDYRRLWRMVDGAVRDALKHHPNYVANGISHRDVRNSIVKRVTGAVRHAAPVREGQTD